MNKITKITPHQAYAQLPAHQRTPDAWALLLEMHQNQKLMTEALPQIMAMIYQMQQMQQMQQIPMQLPPTPQLPQAPETPNTEGFVQLEFKDAVIGGLCLFLLTVVTAGWLSAQRPAVTIVRPDGTTYISQ